jgi:hypothetical protein
MKEGYLRTIVKELTIEAPGVTSYSEQKLEQNLSWRAWTSNRPVTLTLHIEQVMSMYRNVHSSTIVLREPDSSVFIGRIPIGHLALHQIEYISTPYTPVPGNRSGDLLMIFWISCRSRVQMSQLQLAKASNEVVWEHVAWSNVVSLGC